MKPDSSATDDKFFCRTWSTIHDKNFGTQKSCPYCVENVLYSLEEIFEGTANEPDPAEYEKWKKIVLERTDKELADAREPHTE